MLEPIRLHVAAKRYLCAVDPAYRDALSAASRQSLALQGGPFDASGVAAFEANPHFREAVRLRHWDDAAKVPGLAVPGLDHYRGPDRGGPRERPTDDSRVRRRRGRRGHRRPGPRLPPRQAWPARGRLRAAPAGRGGLGPQLRHALADRPAGRRLPATWPCGAARSGSTCSAAPGSGTAASARSTWPTATTRPASWPSSPRPNPAASFPCELIGPERGRPTVAGRPSRWPAGRPLEPDRGLRRPQRPSSPAPALAGRGARRPVRVRPCRSSATTGPGSRRPPAPGRPAASGPAPATTSSPLSRGVSRLGPGPLQAPDDADRPGRRRLAARADARRRGSTLRHYKLVRGLPEPPRAPGPRRRRACPSSTGTASTSWPPRTAAARSSSATRTNTATRSSPFDKARIDELILGYLATFLDAPGLRVAARWHGTYAKHPTEHVRRRPARAGGRRDRRCGRGGDDPLVRPGGTGRSKRPWRRTERWRSSWLSSTWPARPSTTATRSTAASARRSRRPGSTAAPEAVNAVMGLPKPEAIRRARARAAPTSPIGRRDPRRLRRPDDPRSTPTIPRSARSPASSRCSRSSAARASSRPRHRLQPGHHRCDPRPPRLGCGPASSTRPSRATRSPRGRPHPDMIRRLMADLGVGRHAAWPRSATPRPTCEEGTNAGCGWVVGVTWGTHPRPARGFPHTHLIGQSPSCPPSSAFPSPPADRRPRRRPVPGDGRPGAGRGKPSPGCPRRCGEVSLRRAAGGWNREGHFL